MKPYLKWKEEKNPAFDEAKINDLYNEGFLFGRNEKNLLYQTRSLRIDLTKFELTSENRRILRKTEEVLLKKYPLPYANYDWTIGKLGKDFYTTKFGDGIFSANKIKELLTDPEKSNFNTLFAFVIARSAERTTKQSPGIQGLHDKKMNVEIQEIATSDDANRPPSNDSAAIGYCITLETNDLVHYCYPFYQLENTLPNLGLGMMLKAIVYAKDQGKKYIYLGSAQRPTDTYKLQFEGLEWFDGEAWKTDRDELKKILEKL